MNKPRYAELYDALYAEKDYAGEVDCVLALMDRNVDTLLDIGCGTGRHARAFAARGVQVTGIDIDPSMIAVAQISTTENEPAVTFLHGGPADAPMGPFAAVVSLFNVVNYVENLLDLRRYFQAVAKRLPVGGAFIFDAWNGLAALLDPPVVKQSRAMWRTQELSIVTTPIVDLWNQKARLDVNIYLATDAHNSKPLVQHSFYHRLWTPRELSDVLEMTGFSLQHIGTWTQPTAAAKPSDWKLLFSAVRA